jgi:L-rhamnose mutarotase
MNDQTTRRVCFLLKVRADRLEDYRRDHETVWPEMLEALSRHGWRNYSLFLRPDGLLIGYLETPDWDAALAGMQDEEVNGRWQEAMKGYFESLGAANADESMTPLEEVFHLA